MATVAKAMACPESGLEVRDRMWLKITIANAFIGMSVKAKHAALSLFSLSCFFCCSLVIQYLL